MPEQRAKILVVGSGVAGMAAAIAAVERGAVVTLAARGAPSRAPSSILRLGLNAALGATFDNDSVEAHVADTMAAGGGHADEAGVRRMCTAAPGIVELLVRMGVFFDRTPEGRIRLGAVPGAAHLRTASAGRTTGVQVLSALSGQVLRAAARERLFPMFGWEFLSLVIDDQGACRGAVVQDLRNMQIKAVAADAVILATGGYPALFAPHAASTESDGAGLAIAHGQGAALSHPEFVEATPLAVRAGTCFRAIPESVLSSGARLWVSRDDRAWHVLEEAEGASAFRRHGAARIVARAMREAAPAKGTLAKAWLDCSHLDPEFVEQHCEPLLDACDDLRDGDVLRLPVEIVPALFRTLGGLQVNDAHAASIPGLYAAGSCAAIYHGSGTLPGNELLASMYGGLEAGGAAVAASLGSEKGADAVPSALLAAAQGREEDTAAHLAAVEGSENARVIAHELGETLFAALVLDQDKASLARAQAAIAELAERADAAPLADRAEWANAEVLFHRRLRHRLALAQLVTAAALLERKN